MGAEGAEVSLNGRKGGGKSSSDRTTRNSSDERIASHKMRYAKREKADGGGQEDGPTYRTTWGRGEAGKGAKGDSRSRTARTHAGQGLALENVKPPDSPIYRPPSEFAI